MVSFVHRCLLGLLALSSGLFAAPLARADETAASKASEPALHHAPIAVAAAHESLELTAKIEHPELVKRALVTYRAPGASGLKELEFARSGSAPYVAVI
ncbi:MAG TPA: hypothetical protein VM686_07115, partial [Polyangiaceae bacterium]|nr:hypothetical protein [Polyangiaceae bacterium]